MRNNKHLLFIAVLSIAINSLAATPKLKFKNNLFKIVQFTDLHWNSNPDNQEHNDSTELLMRNIIETEKPDLVVITGDIVVSKGAKRGWTQVTKPMTDSQTPFAITFGNHDTESDLSKSQVLELLKANPYNLTSDAGKEVDGVGNTALAISSSTGKKDAWLIYLLDSHAYVKDSLMGYYDWIKKSQIDWYVNQSRKYAIENSKILPAIAFFHIPIQEYEIVRNYKVTMGNHSEEVCSSVINSGLFYAFLQQKDVMATFVGHDHNNDYIGSLANISLAYGRKTGYCPAYKEVLARGARVIELHENEKEIKTYIRTLADSSYVYTFKQR